MSNRMNEKLPQEAPKKKLLMVKQEQIIRGNNQQAPSSASSGLAPNQEVSKLIRSFAHSLRTTRANHLRIYEYLNGQTEK